MRTLVSAVLQAFGVKTVFEAQNAEEAWEIMNLNPCDIIFVDWVMNGMTGLEFTEKVRSAPDSPNPFVPIVMLTGHTSIERVNAARDAGVNEFLAKPVSSKAILTRLVAVIEHPRPFVRTRAYFGPCRRRRARTAPIMVRSAVLPKSNPRIPQQTRLDPREETFMAKQQPIEIFMPPNILKAKVGGSGGLDSPAIKRAEAAIEELKVEFAGWIIEDVNRLMETRNAYETQMDNDRLGNLYRAAHDLKGQATTFDFPLVARVASSLCKLTDDTSYGLKLPLKLIDAHVDAIKVIVRDQIKDPSNKMAQPFWRSSWSARWACSWRPISARKGRQAIPICCRTALRQLRMKSGAGNHAEVWVQAARRDGPPARAKQEISTIPGVSSSGVMAAGCSVATPRLPRAPSPVRCAFLRAGLSLVGLLRCRARTWSRLAKAANSRASGACEIARRSSEPEAPGWQSRRGLRGRQADRPGIDLAHRLGRAVGVIEDALVRFGRLRKGDIGARPSGLRSLSSIKWRAPLGPKKCAAYSSPPQTSRPSAHSSDCLVCFAPSPAISAESSGSCRKARIADLVSGEATV